MSSVKVLVVSLASDFDMAGELGAILGSGFEVTALRGADRQKLELALDRRTQYDIVHFCGHGSAFVLAAGDGLLPEAELLTLMEQQKALLFVIVATCDGLELAGGLHNTLHVPIVAFTGQITDRAAIEFERAFYRAWRSVPDVQRAVDRGREALAVLFPAEAGKVRLINGDMVRPADFVRSMALLDARLTRMDEKHDRNNLAAQKQLEGINMRLNQIEAVPQRWLWIGVCLVLVLIAAQFATPFIASALREMGR